MPQAYVRFDRKSVGRSIGHARILSPANLPNTLAPGKNQHLAGANDFVGRPLVSSQGAVESYNRCIRADERQLFQPLALNAITEYSLMHLGGSIYLPFRFAPPISL